MEFQRCPLPPKWKGRPKVRKKNESFDHDKELPIPTVKTISRWSSSTIWRSCMELDRRSGVDRATSVALCYDTLNGEGQEGATWSSVADYYWKTVTPKESVCINLHEIFRTTKHYIYSKFSCVKFLLRIRGVDITWWMKFPWPSDEESHTCEVLTLSGSETITRWWETSL